VSHSGDVSDFAAAQRGSVAQSDASRSGGCIEEHKKPRQDRNCEIGAESKGLDAVLCRGGLEVLKGSKANWRYFVIYHNRVEYFADKSAFRSGILPSCRLLLPDILGLTVADTGIIDLEVESRTFQLKCADCHDTERWFAAWSHMLAGHPCGGARWLGADDYVKPNDLSSKPAHADWRRKEDLARGGITNAIWLRPSSEEKSHDVPEPSAPSLVLQAAVAEKFIHSSKGKLQRGAAGQTGTSYDLDQPVRSAEQHPTMEEVTSGLSNRMLSKIFLKQESAIESYECSPPRPHTKRTSRAEQTVLLSPGSSPERTPEPSHQCAQNSMHHPRYLLK
jgi:hypothetical protein